MRSTLLAGDWQAQYLCHGLVMGVDASMELLVLSLIGIGSWLPSGVESILPVDFQGT